VEVRGGEWTLQGGVSGATAAHGRGKQGQEQAEGALLLLFKLQGCRCHSLATTAHAQTLEKLGELRELCVNAVRHSRVC
jgi:hypothetical protein